MSRESGAAPVSRAAGLLRKVPLFSGLDDESLATLGTASRTRMFRAGEAIFHEGDPGHTLYVVLTGRVNIEKVTAEGEMVHLAARGPGEPFGELALVDGRPRMADAVTAEPTELLILGREEFLRCLQQRPEVALAIIACLADRLREAGDQLTSVQTQDVLGRVSALLLDLAEEHGIADSAGGLRIGARVTQRDLAERLNASRESVNRAFSSLKQVKAIRLEGRQVIVLDELRLRRYANR